MKIYDKRSFLWGIVFLIPLPLFALDILKADWWQWCFTLALSAKFLLAGLSKSVSARQKHIAEHYQSTAQMLHGKYACVKINLPWIVAVIFFASALFVRLVPDIIIPVWIVIVFVLVLTVCAFYSIGIQRQITEQIEKELS